ncbi:MAG: hypothetical protein WC635_14620 [Bacteriovorax sp.]|jgi:hypothetical protein
MKIILITALLATISACTDFSAQTQDKKQTLKQKKAPSLKKMMETKKSPSKNEMSGTLTNGIVYEVAQEDDGYVVSFNPFIARNDELFTNVTNQIISKLYSDKINDESHISIESSIDYTIYKGAKARYKIVPFIETNGEISFITITSLM